ncbi:MAG TPA: porin [Azonexus sp.]
MQKKIIALAIAGLASTAAFAQTNVTVYGIADVAYVNSFGGSEGSQHNITSGGLSGSRIGFRGTEDLGNGLKALFVLEYGVDIDENNGIGDATTAAGARQQMLGLTDNFDTFVAGRLQTAGYDFACGTSPIAGSALDAHNAVGVAALLNCNGAGRADNAVAYISPNWSGFSFAYNHARVTEAAAASNNNDVYANLLAGSYVNGPLNVNLTYARVDDNDEVALGAEKRDEYGIRASYDFKVLTAYAAYQTLKLDGSDRNKKWSLGVAVPVGAKGTIVAQYAGNDIETADDADSSAYTLAYTHALSKRTTAYAGITHVRNDENANLRVGHTPNAAALDENVSAVAIGVRHTF